MDSFDVVWQPSAERAAASNTAGFMRAHGIETFDQLVRRSTKDPEWFWEAVVEFLGLPFDRPWRAVRDTSRGHQWATWFVGGSFNLSRVCVDRWAEDDSGRVALRCEKTAQNFAAFVSLACTFILVKSVHTA